MPVFINYSNLKAKDEGNFCQAESIHIWISRRFNFVPAVAGGGKFMAQKKFRLEPVFEDPQNIFGEIFFVDFFFLQKVPN